MGSFRYADVVGALSIVCDLGFGLPPEQALRASLVSTALARRAGVAPEDEQAAFYVPLLLHIGCISMSHETAAIFGNELAITRAVAMTNLGDPDDIVATLIPQATRGLGEAAQRRTADALAENPEFGKHYDTTSVEVARRTARRIGLPPSVEAGLYESAENWQGDGAPNALAGDAISLAARIARIGSDAAFFAHLGGVEMAIAAVEARAGTLFDPSLVDTFVAAAPELLADTFAHEPAALLSQREPQPHLEGDDDALCEIAAAYGDAADLKSPYTHGHAQATTQIAHLAASESELPGDEVRVAASLRDLGRVAVSDAVWEKPGPLSTTDREQVQMHSYYAERMLDRSARLRPLARAVGMHHERLDGSGYHRGSKAQEIRAAARLVAVADAWTAMQQARPHRPALTAEQAADELERDAKNGKLDAAAVESVLRAAGRTVSIKTPRPAGLTGREIEVLRLMAAGRSNPEIASELHISPRTAEHHVQHIYTKIGVSTRPAAALFALENDLLEPLAT